MRLIVFLMAFLASRITHADEDIPLNQYPFIMSHDAGSGYLGTFSAVEELVVHWTATQSVGLGEQLVCGARAFDARPAVDKDGDLVWHHGDIIVNHSFSSSIQEVISWCEVNPSELVVMVVWDCIGDGCDSAVSAALTDAGINPVIDCTDFKAMSLGSAKARGELENGGHFLVIHAPALPNGEPSCSYSNYLPSNACSGTLELSEGRHVASNENVFRCYDGEANQAIPIDFMFSYLDNTSAAFPSSAANTTGQLWQMQGIWQETVASVILGTQVRSSLLEDEARSSINTKIAVAVSEGRWDYINFLEVNNVCDGGQGLLEAIGQRKLSRAALGIPT
jgi:hypothetical protein